MKRLLTIGLLVLLTIACAHTQTIYYQDSATLAWDPVLLDAEGTPWLPSDVVEYEVYLYDKALGPADPYNLTGWQYVGVTSATELFFVLEYRAEWDIGVRTKVTDSGSNVTYSDRLGWSGNAADTQGGVPFMYVPLLQLPPPAGLRDSRT